MKSIFKNILSVIGFTAIFVFMGDLSAYLLYKFLNFNIDEGIIIIGTSFLIFGILLLILGSLFGMSLNFLKVLNTEYTEDIRDGFIECSKNCMPSKIYNIIIKKNFIIYVTSIILAGFLIILSSIPIF